MRRSLVPWLCCLAIVTLIPAGIHADAAPPTPLPVVIAPTDPNLYYIGRADNRDPAGPRFEWPHSMVVVRFTGTDIQVRINELGDDYYQLTVDNLPPQVVHPPKGEDLLDIATSLPAGHHVVTIVKRTESFVGAVQVRGFYLSAGGKLDKPIPLAHKVEVIGDSISCGYGNEAASEHQKFLSANENADLAYGALAANSVDAEYMCIAWSGRKMAPDNTIPEIYDRALPTEAASAWDFTKWIPDAVLINLATNDFGKENPDEKAWTSAYEIFVHHVRSNYPHALIYLAYGSMMSDSSPPNHKALTTLYAYLDRIKADLAASGETNVRIIHFDPQDSLSDGLGSDYHPSARTDRKMAAKWAAALQADLGWKLVMLP